MILIEKRGVLQRSVEDKYGLFMTPRRIRIKNWLALCFCQLERRPVSILAVNYLNPQGELFNEDKT